MFGVRTIQNVSPASSAYFASSRSGAALGYWPRDRWALPEVEERLAETNDEWIAREQRALLR